MLTSEAPDLLSVRYRGVKANVPLSRVYPAIVTRTFAMLGAIIADAGVCVSCRLSRGISCCSCRSRCLHHRGS